MHKTENFYFGHIHDMNLIDTFIFHGIKTDPPPLPKHTQTLGKSNIGILSWILTTYIWGGTFDFSIQFIRLFRVSPIFGSRWVYSVTVCTKHDRKRKYCYSHVQVGMFYIFTQLTSKILKINSIINTTR